MENYLLTYLLIYSSYKLFINHILYKLIFNVDQHKISYNGCGESYSDDPPEKVLN